MAKLSEFIENTAIIIPHYGRDELLHHCIEHVTKNPHIKKKQLYIIDNNKKNHMFTVACNMGIKKAIEKGYRFVWLLNNDTEPKADYLNHSITRLLTTDRCALVGGKNLRGDNRNRIYWGGSYQAFPSGLHKTGYVSKGDLNKPTIENWATFSSVVIDTRVFSIIGYLDESMKMICSDSDFSFRLRLAGFSIWYEPKSEVIHDIGFSGISAKARTKAVQKIIHNDWTNFYNKWRLITGCRHKKELDNAINRYINRFN